MGASIAIAFKSQLQHSISRKELFLKVIRRAVILFALGLIVSNRSKKGKHLGGCITIINILHSSLPYL